MNMKVLVFPAIVLFALSLSEQEAYYEQVYKAVNMQDTTKQSSLSQLLSLYYDVKNALVNSDAATASIKAGNLLKAIEITDKKTLSASDNKAFSAVEKKLAKEAKQISETKDIDKQRGYFTNLSQDMYKLAKATRLSTQTVYQEYCPMKKAYWLSNDSTIENPYYGSQMLSCGKVTDTLKK